MAAATRSPLLNLLTPADLHDFAHAIGPHHHVRLHWKWITAAEKGKFTKIE
jgi:hypothetical protein